MLNKKPFLILHFAFCILLSSCCTSRIATSSTDSLVVRHYEAERETIRDTIIEVALPRESIEVYIAPPCPAEPNDSVSIIETSLAISEVRLNRDGSTTHSLRNKADTLHIEATLHDKETIIRDSVFTKQTLATEKTITKRGLPSWLWWLFIAGGGFLLLRWLRARFGGAFQR